MKINYFATTNSITLFWDKPDKANKNTVYEIYIDGIKVGETAKTHYAAFGLEPEHEYNIKIKSSVWCDRVKITTSKEKCRLDITKQR